MTSYALMAGCGDLGTAAGLRLLDRGWQVTGLRRSPASSAAFRMIPMDLTRPEVQQQLSAEQLTPDAVVVALTADGRSAADYERTYRRGLQGLRRLLGDHQPRLIFVSSTSVIGPYDGQSVTERTPAAPATPTAEMLLAAEQDAREIFEDLIVLRPAGIYGPGRRRTIERIRRGDPLDHSQMTNRIHRDDLADLVADLVAAAQPPQLLHAADGSPTPQGEVAGFIAERLSVPVPPDSGDGRPRGKRIETAELDRFRNGLSESRPLRWPSFREGYASLLDEQHSQR